MNGQSFTIYTFSNTEHQIDQHGKHRCAFLNLENGYCGIYDQRPFLCDYAPVSVRQYANHNVLSNGPFGRAWNRIRVTGQKGAACTYTLATDDSRKDIIRKLTELKRWADYFCIETHLDEIINWSTNIPLDQTKPLIIPTGEIFDVI